MRKRITGQDTRQNPPAGGRDWLDLENLVTVELTSEAENHTIESALRAEAGDGWRAQQPGEQTIRLLFDVPHRIRRIQLEFREAERQRTQEFVLRWSRSDEATAREIVRQQYNFSPPGSGREVEDYVVDLDGLTLLELCIVPDISGGEARASLARLRLA
jgi:hypothetical protein